MIIEKCTILDEPELIVSLVRLLSETYKTNFPVDESLANCLANEKIQNLQSYLNKDSAHLVIAKTEREIVGFVWFYEHEYFGERRMHVNHIAVDEIFRNKGVGKLLMCEVERISIELGIQAIDLFVSHQNMSAKKMYTSTGFSIEREQRVKNLVKK